MSCNKCDLLIELYNGTERNTRQYWVMTELFVELHSGDVCRPKKRAKDICPAVTDGKHEYRGKNNSALVFCIHCGQARMLDLKVACPTCNDTGSVEYPCPTCRSSKAASVAG